MNQRKLYTSFKILFFFLFLISLFSNQLSAQDQDYKRKNNFIALPATAYTPELGFTLGALGSIGFDIGKGDTLRRLSQVSILAVITTKGQKYLVSRYELNTIGQEMIFEGELGLRDDVDRHYGIGNDATLQIQEFDEELQISTPFQNFRNIASKRINFNLNAYKRINQAFYAGLGYDFRTVFDYSAAIKINKDLDETDHVPVQSLLSGIGAVMRFDTRENINNPLEGTYIQAQAFTYGKFLGSEYNFSSLFLDVRKYINTTHQHTLAIRLRSDQRYHQHDALPMYNLSTVGGSEFMRGYYEGTYRDNHLLAWEAEYRVPLWHDENSKFWEFWKRLGFTVFAGTAKVYPSLDAFNFNDFRWTVGIGGRYVLSFTQKANLRVDLGWGLDPYSDGDKGQFGVYFFIGEAF